MESAEDIITAKLEELEEQLAAKLREEQDASSRVWDGKLHSIPFSTGDSTPPTVLREETSPFDRLGLYTQIESLNAQVRLLEELKAQMDTQRTENKAHFLAIEKRDEHSSQQSFWLTVISSAISLIIGWLLSLLSSPAALVHAFGR